MATSEQLDRQFRRELEAKQEGMTRLAERTRAAEDRSYASSTVPTIRHKVGAWLVDRLARATGWVGSKVTYKQCRQSTVITYQPEFLRAQEALLAQAQNYCACLWPMLCEPNDWTGQHSGGYLTNDIRKLSRLVRVRDYGGLPSYGTARPSPC
jgi:hypothetical protein